MPKIYDALGINYNKGTKKVNSVAPGCTIEYEADAEPNQNRPRKRKKRIRSLFEGIPEKFKPTDAELLAWKRSQSETFKRDDTVTPPGVTVKITSMADKDLKGWPSGKKRQTGDVPEGFCIAPAYNKGAYQVIPKGDIDAYRNKELGKKYPNRK